MEGVVQWGIHPVGVIGRRGLSPMYLLLGILFQCPCRGLQGCIWPWGPGWLPRKAENSLQGWEGKNAGDEAYASLHHGGQRESTSPAGGGSGSCPGRVSREHELDQFLAALGAYSEQPSGVGCSGELPLPRLKVGGALTVPPAALWGPDRSRISKFCAQLPLPRLPGWSSPRWTEL